MKIDAEIEAKVAAAWRDGLTTAQVKERFPQCGHKTLSAIGHKHGVLPVTKAGGFRARSYYR
jgi:hypothetical protein